MKKPLILAALIACISALPFCLQAQSVFPKANEKTKLFGLVNSSGHVVVKEKYRAVQPAPGGRFIMYNKKGRADVYDAAGKRLFGSSYDTLLPIVGGSANGYYVVRKKNKWGTLDARGKKVIAVKYDKPAGLSVSRLAFMKGNASHLDSMRPLVLGKKGKYFMITPLGRRLDDSSFSDLRVFAPLVNKKPLKRSDLRVARFENNTWSLADGNYKPLIKNLDGELLDVVDNMAFFLVDRRIDAYDLETKQIKHKLTPPAGSSGYIIERRGQYGFIDIYSGMAVPFSVDSLGMLPNGWLIQKDVGKYSLLNERGAPLIAKYYSRMYPACPGEHDTRIIVSTDGRLGLISQTGESLTSLNYVEMSCGGEGKVKFIRVDGAKGYIDRSGAEYITTPAPGKK